MVTAPAPSSVPADKFNVFIAAAALNCKPELALNVPVPVTALLNCRMPLLAFTTPVFAKPLPLIKLVPALVLLNVAALLNWPATPAP